MSNSVIAKFRLSEAKTTLEQYNEPGVDGKYNLVSKKLVTLVFYPVVQGSEENKKFWKYTPSGKIELGTVNQEVVNDMELGKEYYVVFSEAKPSGA